MKFDSSSAVPLFTLKSPGLFSVHPRLGALSIGVYLNSDFGDTFTEDAAEASKLLWLKVIVGLLMSASISYYTPDMVKFAS